eukprot:3576821-Rhodomonas_salina.1
MHASERTDSEPAEAAALDSAEGDMPPKWLMWPQRHSSEHLDSDSASESKPPGSEHQGAAPDVTSSANSRLFSHYVTHFSGGSAGAGSADER